MDETNEMYEEAIEADDYEYNVNSNEEYSAATKVVLAAGAVLTGIGTAVAIKNRDRIVAKYCEFKEHRRAKKIRKHIEALKKLGARTMDEEPTETEKEE